MKNLASFLFFMLFSMQVFAAPKLLFSIDKQEVAPGEQVNLEFTAITEQYFVDSPEYSMPYIANAMIKQERSSVLPGYTYIDGKKYTSQRWSIQVYPNKAGVYLIPSMDVSLFTVGDDLHSVKTALKTKPVALMVKSPIEMIGRSGYLVSPKVSVEDNWSNNQGAKSYNKGDLLQRTITIKAENTSSFMMPDFVPSVPEGISASLMEPNISSNYERGQHSATLTQKISYSIDKPGQYRLGNESVSWWNPDTRKAENWKAESLNIDAGGMDYLKLGKWFTAYIVAMLGAWIMRLGWLKIRSSVSNLKLMLSVDNSSWLNNCYAKINDKEKSPRLLENSSNRELVRYSMQREFFDNKRLGWWQRLKLFLSI
ncbi:TPA: BatD family protein [Vibrio harveyi]